MRGIARAGRLKSCADRCAAGEGIAGGIGQDGFALRRSPAVPRRPGGSAPRACRHAWSCALPSALVTSPANGASTERKSPSASSTGWQGKARRGQATARLAGFCVLRSAACAQRYSFEESCPPGRAASKSISRCQKRCVRAMPSSRHASSTKGCAWGPRRWGLFSSPRASRAHRRTSVAASWISRDRDGRARSGAGQGVGPAGAAPVLALGVLPGSGGRAFRRAYRNR